MRNVMLKITGSQIRHEFGADSEQDVLEFITEGQLCEKSGSLYVLYKETELSGFDGCTTTLKIADGSVRMKRIGKSVPMDTVIEFEEGKRYEGYYATPFGTIMMEVLTNTIENSLTAEADGKGKLDIDYHVSLRGLSEGRNKLSVEIL